MVFGIIFGQTPHFRTIQLFCKCLSLATDSQINLTPVIIISSTAVPCIAQHRPSRHTVAKRVEEKVNFEQVVDIIRYWTCIVLCVLSEPSWPGATIMPGTYYIMVMPLLLLPVVVAQQSDSTCHCDDAGALPDARCRKYWRLNLRKKKHIVTVLHNLKQERTTISITRLWSLASVDRQPLAVVRNSPKLFKVARSLPKHPPYHLKRAAIGS